MLIEPFPRQQLNCPQSIFVCIVAISYRERKSRVGVPLPAPSEINRIVNARDLVLAADSQCYRVVFAVAHVWKTELPQQGNVEGARSSKPVDPERITATVLTGPFAMIDQAGRNCLKLQVDNRVGTYCHRVRSFVELRDDSLEHALAGVQIIRIQLHGILTTRRGVHSFVPASTNSQIRALRFQMDQPAVIRSNPRENISRAVRGMIVDDDYIAVECCTLGTRAPDAVVDRALAIAHRDHDARSNGKALRASRNSSKCRSEVRSNSFQVFNRDLLHFNLIVPMTRVDIVKLLFADPAPLSDVSQVHRLWNSNHTGTN